MTSPDPAGPVYVVVRALSTDQVMPVIGGFWERAEFPRDLAKRMGAWGPSRGCSPDWL